MHSKSDQSSRISSEESLNSLVKLPDSASHRFTVSYGELRSKRSITEEECVYALATPDLTTYGIKLGWIQGVLIPCLLNIWGVMLFLRIAWVVAQAGIGFTILIIFISSVVCVVTTLSLSAICTNGKLQGGGVYFIVSRSLGAELGASVGIIFAFANAVAASMNTIGFCESLNELLKSKNLKIIDNGENDIRIVGAIALFLMCSICAVGMDWETKTQNFLIICIVTAISFYIIGCLLGPNNDKDRAEGFMGISIELAKTNWVPDFRYSEGRKHNFISVFAVYFPAVTGVQAGANICGDLKDPATAIPKGTLTALAISISSYLTMSVLSGMGALRDASGNVTHVNNTAKLSSCKPDCTFGLHNNYSIMHLMSLWSPAIYAGCWAATLSTALTNLLAVPRLIQALGLDGIYPGLAFFSKPYGRHGEPYRGYVLVFIVSLLFLLIADLNTIARLITNFYLASYALINFCTFHAGYYRPLTWRPSFRFYNMWLSLAGCIICVIIMMIMSWIMALLIVLIFLMLYLIVLYRKPETKWGSSSDAQHYQETITRIIELSKHGLTPKMFHPQILVLSGRTYERDWLIDLATLITSSVGSFLIAAEICNIKLTLRQRQERKKLGEEWLCKHKSRGFYLLMQNRNMTEGLEAILQCAGFGQLSPNIMLVGYMYKWREKAPERVKTYYRWLQTAFKHGVAVAILRVSSTFRPPKIDAQQKYLSVMPEFTNLKLLEDDRPAEDNETQGELSGSQLLEPTTSTSQPPPLRMLKAPGSEEFPIDTSMSKYKPLVFHQNSILDAWWLSDDGGMNILLPYIIAQRSSKDKMQLRIFIVDKSGSEASDTYAHVKKELSRLRIKHSSLTVVEGIKEEPADSSLIKFNYFIQNHMTTNDTDPFLISKADYARLITRSILYVRLWELLVKYSFTADLIVMSLPYPRENLTPIALYMAWLEMMSCDLPNMLFIRGNYDVMED